MAALIRCLGNFTSPFHATSIPRFNATFKSFSTEPSTQESKLQSLADQFKISSEDQKFRHRKDLYFRHVRRLADAKQFDLIEDVLEHQKKFPDIHHEGFAIRLISLYGESGMFQHARKLFDQLPELGCPRTVKSFNALLKSAIAAKEFESVVELFKDLPSAVSVEPNVVSYNTVIHALCEMGSLDEALSIFRDMDKKATIVTFNTLLTALYKGDRSAEAEKLWAAMEESEAGVKPDARSYNVKMRARFYEKKDREALSLAAEMRSKGIEPDSFTYNTLIRGLCGIGNLKEAKKSFDDLRKSKCTQHFVSTYLALIPACCEAGDFDKAFELCSDAVKNKVFLNSDIFEQVIDGLTEKGRNELASELKNLTSTRN